MIRSVAAILTLLLMSILALAEPTVLVLPFDPIIDSVYGYYGGKESILDYRNALEQMLTTELGKHQEIWVVEPARLDVTLNERKLSPARWNDPALASELASSLSADYAVIGTYGEFSKEIRVDARVIIAATGDVPPGTPSLPPSAFGMISPRLQPKSPPNWYQSLPPVVVCDRPPKGCSFPKAISAAYDPNRAAPRDYARLVVWVNAPAPQITAEPASATFARCDRIDIMAIPAEKQRTSACQMAMLPAGAITVRINHRGYLPYVGLPDSGARESLPPRSQPETHRNPASQVALAITFSSIGGPGSPSFCIPTEAMGDTGSAAESKSGNAITPAISIPDSYIYST